VQFLIGLPSSEFELNAKAIEAAYEKNKGTLLSVMRYHAKKLKHDEDEPKKDKELKKEDEEIKQIVENAKSPLKKDKFIRSIPSEMPKLLKEEEWSAFYDDLSG
jgi:reverse gyrase